MKKIFFFCFLLLIPEFVFAGSIKELEVKNGTLSRKFESNNNVYSILLNEGEERPIFEYLLENEQAIAKIEFETIEQSDESITKIHVKDENGTNEVYTFYIENESSLPVFQEIQTPLRSVSSKMPHLELYVGGVCFFIVIILFKCIVLGFKKKN